MPEADVQQNYGWASCGRDVSTTHESFAIHLLASPSVLDCSIRETILEQRVDCPDAVSRIDPVKTKRAAVADRDRAGASGAIIVSNY